MFKKIVLISFLLFILFLSSCRSYKPIASTSVSTGLLAQDYINSYKDLAVSEMKRTGVPASITLAQGIIESDYGRSRLAREANNHFGIKCHNDWKGPRIRHHDDRRNECFRKYRKAEESFIDHSDFLKNGSRYRSLFSLNTDDYKGWARGLKKAGYATNPHYANMLIKQIEENKLWYFDRGYKGVKNNHQQETIAEVKEKNDFSNRNNFSNGNNTVVVRPQRIIEKNRIQHIIVKEGDTREKLENEFNLLRWELPKYNELNSDFVPVPGQILYLQPKRNKAEPGKNYYTTKEGDTMYLISQHFGIKLNSLYKMNRMNEGEEPGIGEKLWLRSVKPVD